MLFFFFFKRENVAASNAFKNENAVSAYVKQAAPEYLLCLRERNFLKARQKANQGAPCALTRPRESSHVKDLVASCRLPPLLSRA